MLSAKPLPDFNRVRAFYWVAFLTFYPDQSHFLLLTAGVPLFLLT